MSLIQTIFTICLEPEFVPNSSLFDAGGVGGGVDAGADAGGVWLFTLSIAKSCPITSHLFPNFTCSSLGLVGSKDLGVISEILVARSIPPNSQRSRR